MRVTKQTGVQKRVFTGFVLYSTIESAAKCHMASSSLVYCGNKVSISDHESYHASSISRQKEICSKNKPGNYLPLSAQSVREPQDPNFNQHFPHDRSERKIYSYPCADQQIGHFERVTCISNLNHRLIKTNPQHHTTGIHVSQGFFERHNNPFSALPREGSVGIINTSLLTHLGSELHNPMQNEHPSLDQSSRVKLKPPWRLFDQLTIGPSTYV